jgi:hypothetical protein
MPLDHWVVISDEDLRLIEDGPPESVDPKDLWDWITDVQDVILDGLETA